VSRAIDRCELTHLARTPIDVALARRQHEAYEKSLEAAGCTVIRLPAGDDMPDSVFVEDIAVVFDELAIVTRPGAASRRTETPAVRHAVAELRPVQTIDAPATLDGGDVLVVGRRVFVGRTGRTNDDGIDAMRRVLGPFGYRVDAVEVNGCLHLKSAVTAIGDNRLLLNPAWVRPRDFSGFALVEVDPSEPFGANALRIGDRVLYSDAFPLTRRRLQHCVPNIVAIDLSETAKAEGGVTCCSLIVESR
jgi:dimethylargininase